MDRCSCASVSGRGGARMGIRLTPEGLQRTDAAGQTPAAGRTWIYVASVGAVLSLMLFFAGRYSAPEPHGEATPASAKSIAVLPFENLSEDKSNAYFAERHAGRDHHAAWQDRRPARHLAQLHAPLQDDAGRSVCHRAAATQRHVPRRRRCRGSAITVRINVQLIRAGANDHLWAGDLRSGSWRTCFAVPSEVATAIATALNLTLSDREPGGVTQSPQTIGRLRCLSARAGGALTPGAGSISGNSRPSRHFREAVRLDPRFAQAWALLAQVNAGLYFLQLRRQSAARGGSARRRETATRLDPASRDAARECLLSHQRDYGARVQAPDPPAGAGSSEALAALARIARRQMRWRGQRQDVRRSGEAQSAGIRTCSPIVAGRFSIVARTRVRARDDRSCTLRSTG